MANVLVVAETRNGELRKVAFEAVTAGRKLADASGGGEVHALLAGPAGIGGRAEQLARSKAHALTLHHSVASAAAITRAHELEAAVYVWTVDDPTRAGSLVRAGADGIITNDPRVFSRLTT